MILSRVSIQRPILATMMSLVLVLFGIIGLSRLPVRELPDIDPPIVSVTTIYPGANAQVVETEVTERLEEQINNIEGIKTLTSESREGVSTIGIEFNLSRDIDVAAQDVRDRVSRVRGTLPQDIREPIIAKQDADAQPIIWTALNSDRYSPLELTTLAEHQIKPRLQGVPGVSSVTIGGEKRFAMRLWLDSDKMAARGVTVLDVERALKEQNIELPSGRVENLDREMTIETRGEMKTAEEYNDLVVRTDTSGTGVSPVSPNGQDARRTTPPTLVRLSDIGRAEAGAEDYRTIARAGGKPCVFLGVVKQAKANTVSVAKGVRAEIASVNPTLPQGCDLWVAYDSSIYVENAIDEVWRTLGIAFLLVVLIIFVFLRNIRSTIIPVVAIPISIIGTFAILYLLGYSVNILTMLALVLTIGIVVDDAIVVLEAIYRHVENGIPPMKAALKAMEEISFAVIAITISLIAVFTPLAFQKSTTGRLFVEFAMAIVGSVVISAFVALTLSPAMAARVLKPLENVKHGPLFNFFERGFDWLSTSYGRVLRRALHHRILILMATLGTLIVTVFAYRALEWDFLPVEDKSRMFCLVFTPNGSTSEFTDRQLQKAEKIVASIPEVASFGAMVAPGFAGPGQANLGVIFVRFKRQSERKRSVQEIVLGPGGVQQRFFAEVEGAMAVPSLPKAIEVNFRESPFELILQNQDLDALNKVSQAIANRIRAMTRRVGNHDEPYLRFVRVGFEVDKPELRVTIDRNRAAALGVSIEDISRTMQILFGGLDLSRIKVGGKEYYVMAQLDRNSRLTPQDLDKNFIRNSKGELIQLSSLVNREQGAAPNAINHYGRLRSASITASPGNVPIGTVVKDVEAMLQRELPPGFLYAWGGDAKNLRESSSEVLWILLLALVIVYMTLAAQFESLLHPLTVILAVPLAAIGALGLLWLLNFGGKLGLYPPIPAMNINLFSLIGLVLLVGLVTKNSILLVEYANQQVAKNVGAHEAMVQAGLVRLRPILMTAFSTIAGILPVAIGFGAGAESRRPMGVAVVGGMLTSTFLTLFVVPVVYTFFSDVATRLRRRGASQPLPAEPVTAK